jgi:hypothetical protein
MLFILLFDGLACKWCGPALRPESAGVVVVRSRQPTQQPLKKQDKTSLGHLPSINPSAQDEPEKKALASSLAHNKSALLFVLERNACCFLVSRYDKQAGRLVFAFSGQKRFCPFGSPSR